MVESGARVKIVLTVSAAPSPWSDDYLSIVEFDLEFRCVLPLKRTTWASKLEGHIRRTRRLHNFSVSNRSNVSDTSMAARYSNQLFFEENIV